MENNQSLNNTTTTQSKKENFLMFIKFALLSLSAGLIQIVSFTLLTSLTSWTYWPCYLIALVLSVLWNFTLNRKLTFKSANNVPIAMTLIALYYLAFTPLSSWWGQVLTNASWNEFVVLIFTMIINMVTEYLFCRYVVYRNSINTNQK